jgi:hypothetical protein
MWAGKLFSPGPFPTTGKYNRNISVKMDFSYHSFFSGIHNDIEIAFN